MSAAATPPPGYRQGVGLALFNRHGLVFAGRRRDADAAAWQMPQGGIDAGETPKAAALRELREETGAEGAEIVAEADGWLAYDFPPLLRAKIWHGRYRGQAQKWFLLRFTGSDADIRLDGHDVPEFDAWQWMELEQLARRIVAFKRDVYERITAEFGDLIERETRRGR